MRMHIFTRSEGETGTHLPHRCAFRESGAKKVRKLCGALLKVETLCVVNALKTSETGWV